MSGKLTPLKRSRELVVEDPTTSAADYRLFPRDSLSPLSRMRDHQPVFCTQLSQPYSPRSPVDSPRMQDHEPVFCTQASQAWNKYSSDESFPKRIGEATPEPTPKPTCERTKTTTKHSGRTHLFSCFFNFFNLIVKVGNHNSKGVPQTYRSKYDPQVVDPVFEMWAVIDEDNFETICQRKQGKCQENMVCVDVQDEKAMVVFFGIFLEHVEEAREAGAHVWSSEMISLAKRCT